MAQDANDEQYFTLEARLASFNGPQSVSKRRASTASSRGGKGALSWPHKALKPADMAHAGFYFNPRLSNRDNVRCFLCHKELDGWEDDDNPVAEHLKHSPGCGWAISSAVYHEVDKSACSDDPRLAYLVDARKATFAGRWPYEGKKGWKCKTKQLVEAGWIWTPSLEADDNTTCVYCHLSLDGWEAGDKPFDEHQRRTPGCAFFDLISRHPAPKNPRGKTARGSKASRASIQSVATMTSDAPSTSELLDDQDASVLTITSVTTQGGRKTKAKKATTGKGRKTRGKKQEAVEDDADAMDVEQPPPPPPKATRGKKRASTEMDESIMTLNEGPAPKKRARTTRASTAIEDSVLTASSNDMDMADAPAPKTVVGAKKKGRVASKTRGRKASAASVASNASTASLRAAVPDDDEIDRQLEADLQRQQEDEQVVQPPVAKGKGGKTTASRKAAAQPKEVSTDYAMFDPAPVHDTDSVVDAELQALEQEMSMHHSAKEITVPKKGRKTGTRKASKQTKKQEVRAKEAKPVEPEPEQADDTVVHTTSQEAETASQDPDVSTASTGTVVKGSNNRAGNGRRGRGRPPKKSAETKVDTEESVPEEPVASPAAADVNVAVDSTATYQAPSIPGGFPETVVSPPPAVPTPPVRKALPALPEAHERTSIHRAPATPRAKHVTHAHSAKQATLSPSQSPQSSDAENRPPSSKPSSKPPASASAARHAFTPLAAVATPVRSKPGAAASPGRPANVIGGLKSTTPWTAVDVVNIFMDKENDGGEVLIPKGADLTSPEKRMTVEGWIYFTAGQAEKKLKHECEGMVSAFETEGTRAMGVLEGLVVD